VGVSRNGPNFSSTPIISGTGKATNFKFAGIFTGSIRAKALKNLGEKGAWAYPGRAQIFRVSPIISGTRKATNFKFGRCIHSIHANKSPLIICEKRDRGRIQGLPNFFGVFLLSQERVRLYIRTSNFVRRFLVSIGTNDHYKFREK